ncbi:MULTISPECIES: CsbD family protein [unclassified Geomicrobium]|uniref:CsbD family protein n=1 Tax=unclassified Geomicrobium TaxID=2628951 RepID=UPI00045ECF6A|nr:MULTISPECIES: CsbD family protein [unclassified Geomicrobium]EZH67048.1 general stress protein CsbD [Bacillaceae bacterium JMAK1]GAJ99768.1 hypothetical protein JCM19055_2801 [Geomicrobium sp. JCM 19055]GAK07304.1 hypothetical protein JCM19038_1034 [Geomicrobium sp. JCM 19038]
MSDKATDKLKGMGNQAKGSVKDAAGKVTNNKKMQAEGKTDKLKGKAQDTKANAKHEMDK